MFIMIKNRLRGFVRFYSSHFNAASYNEKTPILYGDEASPPVRFVLMTASALNIKMDFNEINLFSGMQKTELYKKINPLQKVPALVIQDQVICDSHAICLYLCRRYNDKSLYPEELCTKIKIDEMLFFNSGTLFPIDSAIFTDYFSGKWPADPNKLQILNSALDHLELHLSKCSWLSGDEMRLCDLCIMPTVTSIYQLVQKTGKHKNIDRWLMQFETKPFYVINKQGLDRLGKFIRIFEKIE